METVLVVLAAASGAALAAALGVLPLLARPRPPTRWLAWANALAAGMMIAAAFALADLVQHSATVPFVLGAVLGILLIHGSRAFSHTEELALNRLDEVAPEYGSEVLLVGSLHSAAEGVAIGAAMASDMAFGIFVATALALHNVPEGTLHAAVFRSRGLSLPRAAAVAVVANLGQVILAVVSFVVVAAVPAVLPWALGFAAGALIYLVMVDLLPESYVGAGSTSIALAVILAMWAFSMLHGVLRG